MVLQEAGWLATAGVVVGLGVAIILMRLVQSMLYGLKPSDPLSLTVSALLLLAVALLAGWTPAVRASRVEPMEALRHEELSNCIQVHSEWATRFRLVCLDIVEVSKSAEHILRFVKEQRLEGVVAKRADGIYLPGKRTGLATVFWFSV
jgi:predicted lysophospholipase L1 biosynthesis ABC-type transport system permease subunit